ncbi:type II toxin-antitoxin system HicB family antitoxin [Levilactobacillus zymae]|uniref:type II toxin-antitoxin system HicB family antitoxin n=1 Tax=Levilactobacillus zymae TaxID=267363 RepID=UPI0028B886A5|nr:type II toxin-antitoxin system HicB family antitoxin [Levilactobacillus zymae]MDT6979546.1 type II toxin-antitoxin system HicB family antitoxin [Levilactobacillus zymae]
MAKKKIVVYPAVFNQDPQTGQLTISFPDVPGALSQADDLGQALLNASEVLGLMLYDEKQLPSATPLEDVQAAYPHDFVQLTAVDLVQAAKEITKPTVKKNTTIPYDLAQQASDRGVNFSAVLTNALKELLQDPEQD